MYSDAGNPRKAQDDLFQDFVRGVAEDTFAGSGAAVGAEDGGFFALQMAGDDMGLHEVAQAGEIRKQIGAPHHWGWYREEIVGEAVGEDAVHEALESSGQVVPVGGVDEDELIGGGYFFLHFFHIVQELAFSTIAHDLVLDSFQAGVKVELVEVEDLVVLLGFLEGFGDSLQDLTVVRLVGRVAEDD